MKGAPSEEVQSIFLTLYIRKFSTYFTASLLSRESQRKKSPASSWTRFRSNYLVQFQKSIAGRHETRAESSPKFQAFSFHPPPVVSQTVSLAMSLCTTAMNNHCDTSAHVDTSYVSHSPLMPAVNNPNPSFSPGLRSQQTPHLSGNVYDQPPSRPTAHKRDRDGHSHSPDSAQFQPRHYAVPISNSHYPQQNIPSTFSTNNSNVHQFGQLKNPSEVSHESADDSIDPSLNSKRSRNATYQAPREVKPSLLTAMGSLVASTSSSSSAASSATSFPGGSVGLRRQLSGGHLDPYLGINNNSMDMEPQTNSESSFSRPRSMSF